MTKISLSDQIVADQHPCFVTRGRSNVAVMQLDELVMQNPLHMHHVFRYPTARKLQFHLPIAHQLVQQRIVQFLAPLRFFAERRYGNHERRKNQTNFADNFHCLTFILEISARLLTKLDDFEAN